MRAVAVAAAALSAVAVTPAGGATQALEPSVTVAMVDEGTTRGWRTVRVEVSGTCGSQAPAGTRGEVSVEILKRLPAGGAVVPATGTVDELGETGAGLTRSFRYRITGGFLATARGHVECSDEETDESAEARSAYGPPLQAPIELAGWGAPGVSYSYKHPRCRFRRQNMEVGAGYDISWQLGRLDTRALFGANALRGAHLRHFRLHIAGGGRRSLTVVPSVRGFARYSLVLNGFYYIPLRPQPVRLWITIRNLESNQITVPVRPRPRGC